MRNLNPTATHSELAAQSPRIGLDRGEIGVRFLWLGGNAVGSDFAATKLGELIEGQDHQRFGCYSHIKGSIALFADSADVTLLLSII